MTKVKIGLCSYSYGNKILLPEVIANYKALGVTYINIKPEFHLPYESSKETIREARKRIDDAGLVLAGTGTTYMQKQDEAEIRQRFEFNKTFGSPLIVIGPTKETLPFIEKMVKEYDIKVALHNHGPSDKYFPTPQSALAAVKAMDARVGLCMDIGHTMRSGVDPISSAKEAGPRLLDMHTKNVKQVDGKWDAVETELGEINLAALFKQLQAMNYAGTCNLEYEVKTKDAKEKMAGIAMSMSYLRGVAAGING